MRVAELQGLVKLQADCQFGLQPSQVSPGAEGSVPLGDGWCVHLLLGGLLAASLSSSPCGPLLRAAQNRVASLPQGMNGKGSGERGEQMNHGASL